MRDSGGHHTPGGDGPETSGPPGSVDPARARCPPPRPVPGRLTVLFRVSFALRGLAVWFAVHFGMAFVGQPLLSPVQAGFLLIVVYVGVALDQRAAREDLLLENAGVPRWVGPGHAVAAAAVLEGVLQVASSRVLG